MFRSVDIDPDLGCLVVQVRRLLWRGRHGGFFCAGVLDGCSFSNPNLPFFLAQFWPWVQIWPFCGDLLRLDVQSQVLPFVCRRLQRESGFQLEGSGQVRWVWEEGPALMPQLLFEQPSVGHMGVIEPVGVGL